MAPTEPPEGEGVDVETFNAGIANYQSQEKGRITITYHMNEKVTGTVPANYSMRNGDPMPDGCDIDSDFVVELDNESDSTPTISGERPTRNSDLFSGGTLLFVSSWANYQRQMRENKRHIALTEEESFQEKLYLNPLRMWMKGVYHNRVENSTLEGTEYFSEEYDRSFDSEGYCTTIIFREKLYIDGTLTRAAERPQYCKGTYSMECVGEVRYY